MPYRRLPNTDQARVRALKTAVEKGELYNVRDLAITLKTLFEARNFLQRFEAAQIYYTQCYENQSRASRKHQTNVKTARLYISHFIQVLNLAVLRDEIKVAHKELYGLPNANTVPDLLSEAALVEWGKKIIEGEQRRTSQGGIPIYNPTIARVKVHYDIFLDSYERQKNYQALTSRSLDELASMRGRADELILDIWNQVEAKFQDVTPNEARLDKCRDYGLIYYYRSNEKVKEENELHYIVNITPNGYRKHFYQWAKENNIDTSNLNFDMIYYPFNKTKNDIDRSELSVYTRRFAVEAGGDEPSKIADAYLLSVLQVNRDLSKLNFKKLSSSMQKLVVDINYTIKEELFGDGFIPIRNIRSIQEMDTMRMQRLYSGLVQECYARQKPEVAALFEKYMNEVYDKIDSGWEPGNSLSMYDFSRD